MSTTATAPITHTAGVPEVDMIWVATMPAGWRIIDVRRTDELAHSEGHIASMHHVPLHELEQAAANWSPTESLILVCRSGARSGKGAMLLKSLGFPNVVSMAGGMRGWAAANLPRICKTA